MRINPLRLSGLWTHNLQKFKLLLKTLTQFNHSSQKLIDVLPVVKSEILIEIIFT